MALILAVAAVTANAQWVELSPYGGPDALPGSALCAGIAPEPGSGSHLSVWMLHGSAVSFWRYDVLMDTWSPRADIGGAGNVGPGGALAFVPDPIPEPTIGWIFAFKGGGSREFWVYYPEANQWRQGPPVPDLDGVTTGGALCYGRDTVVDEAPAKIVYALTGNEDLDGHGRFYRYVFPVMPRARAEYGSWQTLDAVPSVVNAGAAITWCDLTASAYPPPWAVETFTGGTSLMYGYCSTYPWPWQPFSTTPVGQGPGACMATLPDSSSSVMLYGGDGHRCDVFTHVTAGGAFIPQPSTPDDQPVREGAGIAVVSNRIFAEFGASNQRRFWYLPVPPTDGGQSAGSVDLDTRTVSVRTAGGQTVFYLRCADGPVALRVVNTAGMVVASAASRSQSGRAELTWQRGSSPSGVYLYFMTTPSGSLGGKLSIVK